MIPIFIFTTLDINMFKRLPFASVISKESRMLIVRQVALVAKNLDAAEKFFSFCLGLKVCYRDPELAALGLKNILFPMGSQFLEFVSPMRPNTGAGRFLDKAGDGGYMVIFQCNDHHIYKQRVENSRIRIAHEFSIRNFINMQLHPKDTGGSFIEIDQQLGFRGDEPNGPWAPSGGVELRTSKSELSVKFIKILSRHPRITAEKWSHVLGRELVEQRKSFEILTDNSLIIFPKINDQNQDKLVAIGLSVGDSHDVINFARELGASCSSNSFFAFGIDWILC